MTNHYSQNFCTADRNINSTNIKDKILIRDARKQLKLSQQTFSDLINTPVATLRDWDTPPGAMLKLAEIALHHPEVFKDVA